MRNNSFVNCKIFNLTDIRIEVTMLIRPRSHLQIRSCECALIAYVNGYSSIRSVIRHSWTTENKS